MGPEEMDLGRHLLVPRDDAVVRVRNVSVVSGDRYGLRKDDGRPSAGPFLLVCDQLVRVDAVPAESGAVCAIDDAVLRGHGANLDG